MQRIVLLTLEPEALDHQVLSDVSDYVTAFFSLKLDVLALPRGLTALQECLEAHLGLDIPLKRRPGRMRSKIEQQLFIPHLLPCLRKMMQTPAKAHGLEFREARCVLVLTRAELFSDEGGLFPGEPAPEERTRRNFVRCAEQPLGVCSIAHLDCGGRMGPSLRKFMRQLLTLSTHSILDLLGLRTCQLHSCLGYVRPCDPEQTSFTLCAECENALLMSVQPANADCIAVALMRYRALGDCLTMVGHRVGSIRIGFREYAAFEEECDWLRVAEGILLETSADRRRHVDCHGQRRNKKRSLIRCLEQAHERQPGCIARRTFSEPHLRQTCQVDMSMSSPFRHECGDLSRWCSAVSNKKHTVGGHYMERGGSLRPKTLATFLDSGLNASLIRKGSNTIGDDTTKLRLPKVMSATIDFSQEQKQSSLVQPSIRRRNETSLHYTIRF